jgi:hypothetical protein
MTKNRFGYKPKIQNFQSIFPGNHGNFSLFSRHMALSEAFCAPH